MNQDDRTHVGSQGGSIHLRCLDAPDLERLGTIVADLTSLLAKLNGSQVPAQRGESSMTRDRLLTVAEVANRLGLSRSHVYKQARHWPFTRKLSNKALRFSEVGLEQWMNSSDRVAL